LLDEEFCGESATNAADHFKVAAALGSALALAGCGGGGGSTGGGATSPTPTPPTSAGLTPQQASRFLGQATNGATRADIDALIQTGFQNWLDTQLNMPREIAHWDWLVSAGYSDESFKFVEDGWDRSMWRQLISAPDQLRQRVGLALLDMLVVSIQGPDIPWRPFGMSSYMDVLLDNAFGNFRNLLGAISTNCMMAFYLTFLDNRKSNGQGSQPDENYAREVMQLFTIGLHELNQDGTEKLGPDGKPIETYGQTDVSQLARVFTGLVLASNDTNGPHRFRPPLVMYDAINETGASTFLGKTVSGGGMGAINAALDIIFNHPNVAPFVSKNLIQRLVTSNPSPAYVGRVAAAFADNGQGVRGDMKAVIRAILLDSEARDLPFLPDPHAGKLRDPVQRFINWARACNARSKSGHWQIGLTSEPSFQLGQSPGRSPSVFNFFSPRYCPPHTAISDAGLVAPEFQITTEQSVIGYANFMAWSVNDGISDVTADYADLLPHASDSTALVDEVNLLLAAGQLSAGTVSTIRNAVDSIPFASAAGPDQRMRIAVMLALVSPEYLAQR